MKKKTAVKGKPRPIARKTTSTALAKRPTATPAKRAARVEVLPAESVAPNDRVLTDGIELGVLGLVDLKLTDAEEAVLSEPVPIGEIQVKPLKAFTPYLSHPGYTRWFNRAFGRLGWALVPVAKPMKSGNSVVCPYVLHVHGKPVAFANGEQEYFEGNKEQTYGDALEATVASALRRCAKRLGVGLELWDRRWLNQFERQYGVRVQVNKAKKNEPERLEWVWRLKTDAPFWNEKRGRQQQAPQESFEDIDLAVPGPVRHVAPPRLEPHKPTGNPDGDKPITKGTPERPGQLEKLWATIRRTGRSQGEVQAWLKAKYHVEASADIKRKDYDDILRAIEASGDLV